MDPELRAQAEQLWAGAVRLGPRCWYWPRALSYRELAQARAYLAAKYGLCLSQAEQGEQGETGE